MAQQQHTLDKLDKLDKEVLLRNGYKLVSQIGKGSFSQVYQGSSEKTGSPEKSAIKIMKLSNKGVQEAMLLSALNHENIIKYTEHFCSPTHLFLVTEYCDEGDLDRYIRKRLKLAECLVKIIMQHLALATKYLQENNICHMDIKPKNVLVISKPRLTFKLSDFGIARIWSPEEIENWRNSGTVVYMAPEKLIGNPYDIRSDLWSLGIVMFQCLFGRPSYFESPLDKIKSQMLEETLVTIPANSHLSISCEDLLSKMLKYNPDRRISFDDFYNHDFIDIGNMPTNNHYVKIIKVANEAVFLDNEKRYREALEKYAEAVDLIQPYLITETNIVQKTKIQIKNEEYKKRIQELEDMFDQISIRKQQPPQDTNYDFLLTLAASTPKMCTGLEIAKSGEEYFYEGNYALGYKKLSEGLEVLIPLCKTEPKGFRQHALRNQVEKWMKLAEDFKKKTQTE